MVGPQIEVIPRGTTIYGQIRYVNKSTPLFGPKGHHGVFTVRSQLMASNLIAMASNLIANDIGPFFMFLSDGLQPTSDGLQPNGKLCYIDLFSILF